MNGKRSDPHVFLLEESEGKLEFSWQLHQPTSDGIVSGKQFYALQDQSGHVREERVLSVQFHLIAQDQIEQLLADAGFKIVELWGDYDRSPFTPDCKFLIYRCQAA